ncbi:MAG TPA: WD40 repeat domain-containing protein, partial [Phycisphaerae bacterium]|nr:WD40 repeat domain-containing protein [Phycisphaerae bacterium]
VAIVMSVLYERTSRAERGLADKSHELSRLLSASNVERAKLMFRTGNVPLAERLLWGELAPRAAELLANGSRSLDPAYWALWELYSDNPCRATFRLEGSRVSWVQFDAEEKNLYAVTLDGRITRIDFASGAESPLGQASAGGRRWELTFQLVGNEYLFVDEQGSLIAEDSQTLARKSEFELTREPLMTASVSSDRRLAAWVGADGRVSVMNLQTHRRMFAPGDASVAGTGAVRPIFSTNGAFLITTGADRTICLWDLGEDIKLRWRRSLDSPATSVTLSHDQLSLAVSTLGEKGARIHLWACADGSPISILSGHMAKVSSLEFSRDDTRLLSCSYDKSVRLWDAATGREMRQFLGHSEIIFRACFSPSEKWIVSSAIDGAIKVWDGESNATRIYQASRPIMSAAYSPAGDELVCTLEGGDIQSWRPDGSQPPRAFSAHTSSVPHVAFLPSGELLTGDYAGRVLIWDFKTAQPLADLDVSDLSSINYLSVSPDGSRFATAHQLGKVRLFDAKTRQPVATCIGRPFRCPVVEFTHDSRLAVGGFTDGTVMAWDAATGEVTRSWHAHEAAIRTLIFSPDGKVLATGGDDWTIKLWDFTAGTLLRKLEGHRQDVFGLAFSSDGRRLASCDRGNSILLWDVRTGQNLAHLPPHRDMVFSVAFSPDDRFIASASIDHTVRVQDLDYYRAHMHGNLAAARAKD